MKIINEIVSVVDDAKTRVWINDDTKTAYRIPIDLSVIDNRLVVTNSSDNNIPIHSEILQINDKTITEYQADFYQSPD
jgi:hypothetical protein